MLRHAVVSLFAVSAACGAGGCSTDETTPSTTVQPATTAAAPSDGPTALEYRVMAQEQIGRSINGVDYECELPVSTDPGTQFECEGELNGQTLHVLATINADGTVTLAMND